MNKEELLNKAVGVEWLKLEEAPIFTGIYIIQQRKLHDSGFRLMYVIGHTEDFKYYKLSGGSDVLDLEGFWSKIILKDLHLDINKYGLIHIWSNKNRFKCSFALSNCTFDILED